MTIFNVTPEHPKEPRFRKLPSTNKQFVQLIEPYIEAKEALCSLGFGFSLSNKCYEWKWYSPKQNQTDSNMRILASAQSIMKEILNDVDIALKADESTSEDK